MARRPRIILPGQPQHVIQRGNNREAIFASEGDYLFYLEKLAAACKRFDCDLHAYVLMTNHVHLLMTPQSGDGIGKVMQSLQIGRPLPNREVGIESQRSTEKAKSIDSDPIDSLIVDSCIAFSHWVATMFRPLPNREEGAKVKEVQRKQNQSTLTPLIRSLSETGSYLS